MQLDVPPGDPRFGRALPCVCTAAGRIAAQRQRLFGAPRLATMQLDTFKALTKDERAALRAAQAALRTWQTGERPVSLLFYAPLQDTMAQFPGHAKALHVTGAGCGKTHLAVALGHAALDAGQDVAFTTESDLLRRIKASYDPAAPENEAEILAELAAARLLILDDLGTVSVKNVDWYQDIIFAIVNERYTSGRPLVLTTNLPPAQLTERIGARAWSRLRELAAVCRLDGPDRRAMEAQR